MKKLDVFLSYSNIDRRIAGLLKQYLETYSGFNAFLAHSDINVSNNWRIKIIDSLNTTDVFIPLLTSSSKHSVFVNQEIGIAYALKKIILPIKIDTNPFGFIESLQALLCSTFSFQTLIQICSKISVILIKDPALSKVQNTSFESLLFALNSSSCFRDTRIIMRMILESHPYIEMTQEYKQYVKNCIDTNEQISGESFLLHTFKQLLKLEK